MPKSFKQIRERLGLSQQELADLLGVHRNTINFYENGPGAKPRLSWNQLKRLLALMEAAGMSADDLPDNSR